MDEPAFAIALQGFERTRPVAIMATEFERRLSGPCQRRRRSCSILGVLAGGGEIVAALRLDEQSVQTEQLGVVAIRHGAKGRRGAIGLPGQLRCLRLQHQQQRLFRREPARLSGEPAGRANITGADGHETAHDRLLSGSGAAIRDG